MNKPLTIEQLKSLEVGDWVWIIHHIGANTPLEFYAEIVGHGLGSVTQNHKSLVVKSRGSFNLYYSDYGTKWLAYKNKEQAESKGEIRRFVEYVGSKIAGHSDYHGDNIPSALYCAAEGKEIKDVTPIEYKGEIVELPCHWGDTVYFIDHRWGKDRFEWVDVKSTKFDWEAMRDWNDLFFATREEAERRLAELRGEK